MPDDQDIQFKVEHTHPHGEVCESFKMALDFHHLIVIEGEVQILGRPPEGTKMGNVLTGEKYDPKDFTLNMAITFCPFCGEKIIPEGGYN